MCLLKGLRNYKNNVTFISFFDELDEFISLASLRNYKDKDKMGFVANISCVKWLNRSFIVDCVWDGWSGAILSLLSVQG